MQFSQLELRDFQVHEEKLIKFSPGITTILGPSDVGKSSIIRALRWICLNDLTGDAFVREGSKGTEVTLTFGRFVLSRIKGRQNIYELNDQEFASIQRDVPKPIADLLLVNEINFQSQHDSPFWFSESAPEVSRRLNAVVDLSVIDTALSNIYSMVRRAAERRSLTEERLKEAKDQLESLKDQQQRVGDFAKVKESNEKLERTQEAESELVEVINQIILSRNKVVQCDERAQQAVVLGTAAKETFALLSQVEQLSGLTIKIERYQKQSSPPPDFTAVEKAWSELDETNERWSDLKIIVNEIGIRQRAVETRNVRVGQAEQRFHEQIKGQRCPICQKPL